MVLAFVGIGFLIYFIHHIALSIQASHILAAAAGETLEAVEQLFPEGLGTGEDDVPAEAVALAYLEDAWRLVPAHRTGYIGIPPLRLEDGARRRSQHAQNREKG